MKKPSNRKIAWLIMDYNDERITEKKLDKFEKTVGKLYEMYFRIAKERNLF